MLQRHLKTHQPVDRVVRQFSACVIDATVDSPPPLLPSSPPKRCVETPVFDVCAKTFPSQKMLKRHRQTVYRQSGGLSCRVCYQRFYQRDHLEKHHIRKHVDEKYEAPATTPDKTVEIFQYNFQFRAMVPSCPKEANSSPLPTPGAMLFRLSSSSVHFLCYRKQHCNRAGGKQSVLFLLG